MKIRCVWEHNGEDTLLYAEDFPGAYTRGRSLAEALVKLPEEISAFCRWTGEAVPGRDESVLLPRETFYGPVPRTALRTFGEGSVPDIFRFFG